MSSLSEQDHLNPNDPSYYAPRWLRERPESRSPSQEPRSGPLAPPASLDTQLEKAVSEALWHPLDPEVILEPPGFAREMDQQRALISVAGRFAAAVGVSAIVALFFVIMIPASRDHAQQADGAAAPATPGILQSIKTVLARPGQKDDDLKPALSEFKPILASTRTAPPAVSHEQSEALLQQFMQWRQKPNSTEAPQQR